MLNLKVTQNGKRLDQYLAEELSRSRTIIQTLIKAGNVLVNGKQQKASYKVSVDDLLDINGLEDDSKIELDDNVPALDLLYEDDDILVLSKQLGVVVHPNDVQKSGTLADALLNYFPGIKDVGASGRPGIVHRLDKDTSGVMVVAKSDLAYESLTAQFKNRTVKKRYIAIVNGNVQNDYFTLNKSIARHTKKRHLYAVSEEGKEAITEILVLERFNTKTIVEARPLTGRTHQIRVHLQDFGHPIIGDPLYGKTVGGKGQALHAFSLSFEHPKTNKRLTFLQQKVPSL
ncbi:RluA family pseudouridine synthase [Candidatus Marinamargulisbacteria bacterium SCGC AAA071-K20]|nr:RluA family pseudouridine synthase [Candidatus Marinamargulisbacteria bacterium SCGC AAA071-K20]